MTFIIALLLAVNLLLLLAAKKKVGLSAALRMDADGMRDALIIVRILLVIGMVTGIWRASGTICAAVYYGIRLITPRLFLPVAFLLGSLLSYALGTSFGIAGTVGVIFMTLARSGGVDPMITGGVLFSAVMVGDRGSPVSSSAITVAHITDTDLYGNVRAMLRTAAVPYLLCLAVYTVLGVLHPIRSVDAAVMDAFRGEFILSPWTFVPAAVILALSLARIPTLYCMALSIASAAAVARFLQGSSWGSVLRACIFGYTAHGEGLAQIISGGGMFSMLNSCAVILLACGCAGIFRGTDMLSGLETRMEQLSARIGTYPVLMLASLVFSALFCNQSISVVMGNQLMRPVYLRRGKTKEDLALDLENTAILVPAFIPWCILCSVPLSLLGVGYGCMRYAVFLYSVPLFNLAVSLLRERAGNKRA